MYIHWPRIKLTLENRKIPFNEQNDAHKSSDFQSCEVK